MPDAAGADIAADTDTDTDADADTAADAAEVAVPAAPSPQDGPLAGFTVGVTADRRAAEQAELLERRGATVVHAPTIRTHPLADEGELAASTLRALVEGPLDIAVLTTALGTRGWIEAAESLGLADQLMTVLGGCELYVRGAKAKGAASALGLPVVWAAPTSASEVRDRLLARGVRGLRIAVQLDGAGNEPMLADLEAAGATVIGIPVYRWTMPEDVTPAIRLVRAVVGRRVDAVTFTTRTALSHLLAIADDVGLRAPLLDAFNSSTRVVCIGPVCAARARQLGVTSVIQPARARLGSMVYEFARRFERAHVEVELRGRRVRIQGRLVVVDGAEPLVLTEREREVLLALTRSGGRVLSKADLLRAVWGPGERDTHLAEVVVARLRQRLGDASDLIETVHRRGYRLATV